MATREQELSEIRRLLNFPKPQSPSSDLIVAAQIRQEQFIMNRLNGSGRGWSPNTIQLTADVDVAEYSLYSDDPTDTVALTNFGKALFVYRELDDNAIVSVPFTDYGSELNVQSREFIYTPQSADSEGNVLGEKIAFFNSPRKARIYPIPEAARVYKIVYATGALDWSVFDWADEPILPEWSHYRCLRAAATLLRQSEWTGFTYDQNKEYRSEVKSDIMAEISEQKEEFEAYLNNPQHEPTISTVGAWYDED